MLKFFAALSLTLKLLHDYFDVFCKNILESVSS